MFLGLLALPSFGQQADFKCATPPPSPYTTERAAYTTVTCSDTLYVQVNVHFVQTDDGTGNFRRFDAGHPCQTDTAWTGYRYAQELLYYANLDQAKNPPLQYNPNGQPRPPQQPKRVKWVLHGVYFDRNTTMREAYGQSWPNLTASDRAGFDLLCVDAPSVINLFMVENRPFPYPYGSNANNPSIPDCSQGKRMKAR